MRKIYEDVNEVGPRSFREEALMEAAAFQRDVIAGMETAESVLTDAANALAKYPGYGEDAQRLHDEASRIEEMRLDLGGFDTAA